MKAYISRAEAAEILGISQQSVSNYVARGLLAVSQVKSSNGGLQILWSSVDKLMNEAYDVVEQTKAIEEARIILETKNKEYKTERDNLDKRHRLLKISDGFHANIHEIAEILSAYLVDNDILPKKQREVLIDILAGRSFAYIADNFNLSVSEIKEIYSRAIRSLYTKRTPTYVDLREENADLKDQIKILQEKNALLEQEKCDAQERIRDISEALYSGTANCISIPKQLIGQDSLRCSARLFNVLKANNIDNLYDLALISKKQLFGTRNFGKKCMDEIQEIMNRYLIEFDNIESLQNTTIKSLPGPFSEIPVYILEKRRRNLCLDK